MTDFGRGVEGDQPRAPHLGVSTHKRQYIRWLLMSVCVLLGHALPGHASVAQPVRVTTSGDLGPGSLRAAISQCNRQGGGTILFDALSDPILVNSDLPVATSGLRILGLGTNQTILLGIGGPHLAFGAGVHTLSGLTLRGCNVTNAGALHIQRCSFVGSVSWIRAVENSGVLEVYNSSFLSCTYAPSNSPATGAGLYNAGRATLRECAFVKNSAQNAGYGGAIYLEQGELVLDQCLFDSNHASGNNGFSINFFGGSEFIGTPGSSGLGGAIYIHSGAAAVKTCMFRTNSAFGGSGGNGKYSSGDGGSGCGGAILLNSGSLATTQCLFVGNQGIAGSGGSTTRGAGGNYGNAYGGAIAVIGGSFAADNCTFTLNRLYGGESGVGGDTAGLGYPSSGGPAFGGGVCLLAGEATIQSCTLVQNHLSTRKGGTYCGPISCVFGSDGPGWGGGLMVDEAMLTLRNTIIAGNDTSLFIVGAPMVPADYHGGTWQGGFNLLGQIGGTAVAGPTDRVTTNPQLGELRDNGGPTWTCAPQPGSPAIDSGNSFGGLQDQRNRRRTVDLTGVSNANGGDGTDIGACELDGPLSYFELDAKLLLHFSTAAGKTYSIRFKTNLMNPAWSSPIGSVIGTGATVTFADPARLTNVQRFYRVEER